MSGKPQLAFVSPVFLFPNNTGGRIRSSNILRGLKGGAFDVTLIGRASAQEQSLYAAQLDSVCDHFVAWTAQDTPLWRRILDLWSDLPVNVAADRVEAAVQAVHRAFAAVRFDVVVFDFVHAAVLLPQPLDAPSVCFTHNVEAEIFARHVEHARNRFMRALWTRQHVKLEHFERNALRRFDAVIAVSERDAQHFRRHYGLANVATIPTGVDLDFFTWSEPPEVSEALPPTVVFIGSMDWAPNVDGIRNFIEDIWPRVLAQLPQARFVVVGRNPPQSLVNRTRSDSRIAFTGFVDDVRPHVRNAHVSVIPLRIGGGTRIKAFEAMAMGCPVVSTSIGIEGLDVHDGAHFLCRDTAETQADAVIQLIQDSALRRSLSRQARDCVEQRFGHRVAAESFESICLNALARSKAPC